MVTGKIPTTALHGKPKKPENGFDERETIKKSKNNKKNKNLSKIMHTLMHTLLKSWTHLIQSCNSKILSLQLKKKTKNVVK